MRECEEATRWSRAHDAKGGRYLMVTSLGGVKLAKGICVKRVAISSFLSSHNFFLFGERV